MRSARQLAEEAYELLNSEWIEDHFRGLRLLDEAKRVDPEAVTKFEKELEDQANDLDKGRSSPNEPL